MECVVKTESLGRRFGRRWAVARVDLSVTAGERLLVIGPNGCGKTTLLRMLATVLPPSQGRMELLGGAQAPRGHIGLMGHETGVYEDLSAAENLSVFARLGGSDATAIPELLGTVGLDTRTDAVSSFSAGMRRRLALAHLLQGQPALALLDEPFAQMDPGGIAQVSRAIQALPGAVIIASHQVHHAAPLCTRAVLMDEGQIRWTGPANKAEAAWKALHKERGDL
jgi:heme exporter protein A